MTMKGARERCVSKLYSDALALAGAKEQKPKLAPLHLRLVLERSFVSLS